MSKKIKTQRCPECGGEMHYQEHDDVLEYQGQRKVIQTLGWWCSRCGEGILTGEPLLAHARAFQELKAEIDHVLGPEEVARVRTNLGLSQRKAGELLGGGPRAFQKYESGQQAVSVPMSNLLRLLARDPSRLDEITQDKARKDVRARSRAGSSATRERTKKYRTARAHLTTRVPTSKDE